MGSDFQRQHGRGNCGGGTWNTLTLWPCTDAVTSSVPLASQASARRGAACARKCATTARPTTSRTITVPTTDGSPGSLKAAAASSPRGDSLCKTLQGHAGGSSTVTVPTTEDDLPAPPSAAPRKPPRRRRPH